MTIENLAKPDGSEGDISDVLSNFPSGGELDVEEVTGEEGSARSTARFGIGIGKEGDMETEFFSQSIRVAMLQLLC